MPTTAAWCTLSINHLLNSIVSLTYNVKAALVRVVNISWDLKSEFESGDRGNPDGPFGETRQHIGPSDAVSMGSPPRQCTCVSWMWKQGSHAHMHYNAEMLCMYMNHA